MTTNIKLEEMTDFKYVCKLEQCNSTMDVAKVIEKHNPVEFNSNSSYSIVIANSQSKARGRTNKKWHSPESKGLYFTLISNREIPLEKIAGLSLAVGVSISNVLSELGFETELKWPNDIVVRNSEGIKKLAGILIETSVNEGKVTGLYIGVGINVSNQSFPNEIAGISLSKLLRSRISSELGLSMNEEGITKEELLKYLLPRLVADIDIFYQEGFLSFKKEWLSNNIIIGSKLKLLEGNDERICRAVDLSDTGQLVIEHENQIRKIDSAEVLEIYT